MAHTYTWTDEHGLEQTCDGPEARRLQGQDAEISLLRRERALLIDLEKTRAGIIGGMLSGTVYGGLVQDVARLNAAVEALHLEASGSVERPPGSACACVLCRPDPRGGTRRWTSAEREILDRAHAGAPNGGGERNDASTPEEED